MELDSIRLKVDDTSDEIYNLSERMDELFDEGKKNITSSYRMHLQDELMKAEKSLKDLNFEMSKIYEETNDEKIKDEIKRFFRRAKISAKLLIKAISDLDNIDSYRSATFYNLKGGVAKTSLTYLTAMELAERGRKVLIIDLDPQGNITLFLDTPEHPIDIEGVEKLFSGYFDDTNEKDRRKYTPKEVISKTKFKNIDVIGTDIDLIRTEMSLNKKKGNRDLIIRKWMHEHRHYINDNYDNVFFDLSPSFSFLNVNGFVKADSIIYVANPSRSTIKGIRGFKKYYLDLIKESVDSEKKYAFVINKIQERRRISDRFLEEIKEYKGLQDIRTKVDIHYSETIKRIVETTEKLTKKDNKRSYEEIVLLVDDLCEKGIL